MQINIPKCVSNNICFTVCNNISCKKIPFMCRDQQCQCFYGHEACRLFIKWKQIQQFFKDRLRNHDPSISTSIKQIERLYKHIIHELQIAYTELKNLAYTIGLNQMQRDVFLKLKQSRFNELKGQQFRNLLMKSKIKNEKKRNYDNIKIKIQQINSQSEVLIKMLRQLTHQVISPNIIILETNIIKIEVNFLVDINIVAKFFTKKIKNFNLLYKASENNFQISKFWDKCHNKSNTITVLRTQFGKIIGGYTPLAWNKDVNDYMKDFNRQSFLFSVSQQQKLPLVTDHHIYAIYNNINKGPIFGSGYDLCISDKANQNRNSHIYGLGYTYNNGIYTQGCPKIWNQFCGQPTAYFWIDEWEVYQISFM